MPVLRSSPKRAQMVLIFGFLGLILSIVYVLLKDYLLNIINEIRS
jgi:uncharacterized protein involved in exopolysaccharide biosynthesis